MGSEMEVFRHDDMITVITLLMEGKREKSRRLEHVVTQKRNEEFPVIISSFNSNLELF